MIARAKKITIFLLLTNATVDGYPYHAGGDPLIMKIK